MLCHLQHRARKVPILLLRSVSPGIILAANAGEKPTVGKVVAVGPGRTEGDKTHSINISVGASVLYQKYSGVEFEEGDKQYIVVKEGDVLAVLA